MCAYYRTTVSHFNTPPPRVRPLQGRPTPIPPPVPVLPVHPPGAFYPPLVVPFPLVSIPVLVPQPAPYYNSSQVFYRNERWEYNRNVYSYLASPQSTESIKHTGTRRPIKIEKPPELQKYESVDRESTTQDPKLSTNEKCNAHKMDAKFENEKLRNHGSRNKNPRLLNLENNQEWIKDFRVSYLAHIF